MNKDIKRILVVLAIFALANGFAYNFRELWMVANNLTVKTIGIVLSLGALISCSAIFICSNIIKPSKLKGFTLSLLIIRFITSILLFLLYKSGLNILIKFIIMVDFALDVEIITCIYPLIATILKNDKIFAIKGLVYDTFYYIAIILVTVLLGKQLSFLKFTYNNYLLISALLLLISIILLYEVDINKYVKDDNTAVNNDLLFKLLKKIKKDKISIYYLIFSFMGNVAFNIITGMVLLVLVNEIHYSSKIASTIILIMGISSALLGFLILSKLTLKNNYINVGIKYVARFLLYLLASIFTYKYLVLAAILYTLITSSLYAHVTDAPYINRFKGEEQLAFANLQEIINYSSKALGVFLCGILIGLGIKYNFITAAIVVLIAIVFIYLAIYNYNKYEVKNDR